MLIDVNDFDSIAHIVRSKEWMLPGATRISDVFRNNGNIILGQLDSSNSMLYATTTGFDARPLNDGTMQRYDVKLDFSNPHDSNVFIIGANTTARGQLVDGIIASMMNYREHNKGIVIDDDNFDRAADVISEAHDVMMRRYALMRNNGFNDLNDARKHVGLNDDEYDGNRVFIIVNGFDALMYDNNLTHDDRRNIREKLLHIAQIGYVVDFNVIIATNFIEEPAILGKCPNRIVVGPVSPNVSMKVLGSNAGAILSDYYNAVIRVLGSEYKDKLFELFRVDTRSHPLNGEID